MSDYTQQLQDIEDELNGTACTNRDTKNGSTSSNGTKNGKRKPNDTKAAHSGATDAHAEQAALARNVSTYAAQDSRQVLREIQTGIDVAADQVKDHAKQLVETIPERMNTALIEGLVEGANEIDPLTNRQAKDYVFDLGLPPIKRAKPLSASAKKYLSPSKSAPPLRRLTIGLLLLNGLLAIAASLSFVALAIQDQTRVADQTAQLRRETDRLVLENRSLSQQLARQNLIVKRHQQTALRRIRK